MNRTELCVLHHNALTAAHTGDKFVVVACDNRCPEYVEPPKPQVPVIGKYYRLRWEEPVLKEKYERVGVCVQVNGDGSYYFKLVDGGAFYRFTLDQIEWAEVEQDWVPTNG